MAATKEVTDEVKEVALKFGAHIAGVTGVERIAGAPEGFRATDIMPEAKSVVVMGVGLPQGLSDCWEQSIWAYLYYGYAIPNKKLGHAAFNLATWLQHQGHKSFPVVTTTFMKDCDVEDPRGEFSHKHAAFAAGLGQFGFSNLFMTPQFGTHNRFVSVLTSAELAPDPLYDGPDLCDRCEKCINICPTAALKPGESRTLEIAGKTIEYAGLDKMACSTALVGLFKEAGGVLDVPVPKKRRTWNKWDFALAKVRYWLKDPVRATVQAEYQHVIDWGDFCGLCLHVCDRPTEKASWDPDLLLSSGRI
jgi:epoxyqueuosine reductase QueG